MTYRPATPSTKHQAPSMRRAPMAESSTRTVERALDLLAVICDADGLTLSESSRAVDLAPSTALRLLR
ncbi:MAG TPA: helix-turn-helix domain-containing protein, partial [Cryobacterium sp.]|nr:helix-turn-helix domain-containing protein [Cryobacterium sp.]